MCHISRSKKHQNRGVEQRGHAFGGHEIKKEGKVTINWVTESGASKKKRSVQERVGVSHADVLTDGRKRHTM